MYSSSVDLWSIGVVLYEAMIGHVPYEEKDLCKLFLRATEQNYAGFVPPIITIPDGPKKYRDIIPRLIQIDPEARLTCEELYQAACFNRPLQPLPIRDEKKQNKKNGKVSRVISAGKMSGILEENGEEINGNSRNSSNRKLDHVGSSSKLSSHSNSSEKTDAKPLDTRPWAQRMADKICYYGCCCCCLKHFG